MVDFNGFDKGVIGKKLPSDATLNNMRKADLIELLHLAESNHRVLAETYKIAIDTSKCNRCPLSIDTRRAEQIKADVIDEIEQKLKSTGCKITFDLPVEEILGGDIDLDDFAMLLQDAVQVYRKMVLGVLKQLKEQKQC